MRRESQGLAHPICAPANASEVQLLRLLRLGRTHAANWTGPGELDVEIEEGQATRSIDEGEAEPSLLRRLYRRPAGLHPINKQLAVLFLRPDPPLYRHVSPRRG